MISEDDFIKPPIYTEDPAVCQNKLFDTLKNRINRDLFQIHGVYDEKINMLLREKQLMLQKVNETYSKLLENIYEERNKDIEKYNQQTENKLSDILSYIDKKEEVVSYPYMLFCYLKTIFKR